jgi:hypothetical protein
MDTCSSLLEPELLHKNYFVHSPNHPVGVVISRIVCRISMGFRVLYGAHHLVTATLEQPPNRPDADFFLKTLLK